MKRGDAHSGVARRFAEVTAAGADPLFVDVGELPPETICANAIDDEQDGLVDCGDPDCELLDCDDQNSSTANDTCRSGICLGDVIAP